MRPRYSSSSATQDHNGRDRCFIVRARRYPFAQRLAQIVRDLPASFAMITTPG